MAADSRQFTEHNEVGGVNVYYEDKRMEELKSATAKTSSQVSTTTDYIPLQDTDGNLVKINLASFEEAVRNVLGGLLANNDKGTTISGVPALSGSGASLDFGSVTPANLASVLGGDTNGGTILSSCDLHKIFTSSPSSYYRQKWVLANSMTYTNAPNVLNLQGTLIVEAFKNRLSLTIVTDSSQIWFQNSVNTSWYDWRQIAFVS